MTPAAWQQRLVANLQKASIKHWPVTSLLLWTISSSSLIMLNKKILVEGGFAFPMTLTAAGQFASFLGGCLLAKTGFMSCRAPPPTRFYLARLLPVAVLTAASLVFGNLAYLTLSVAFIQILKTAMPAVVLIMCAVAGLERLTGPLTLSVFLITAGTGVVAILERHTGTFSWTGVIYFALSAVSESFRVLYIQVLLGNLHFNAVEVLVYLSPATAVVLAIGACFWEQDGLLAPHGGFSKVAHYPGMYLLASVSGFAVNVTSYWAIEATSSLTFKVFGCVKNGLVVLAGVLTGDQLSSKQLGGYTVSVIGFVMYTNIKAKHGQKAHAKLT